MGSGSSTVLNLIVPEFRRRWGKTTGRQARWIAFVFFYAVLANIPYWFVSRAFGFRDLGWFCIQYATVGLIALLVPRLLAAILLLFIISADLLCGICLSFSLPIRRSLEEIRSVHVFSGQRLICIGFAILLVAIVAALSVSLPGNIMPNDLRKRAAAGLVAFVMIVVGSHVLWIRLATGYVPPSLRAGNECDGLDVRMAHVTRLARIPVIRLVNVERAEFVTAAAQRHDGLSAMATPSATQIAIQAIQKMHSRTHDRPDVVQVVVESWGLPDDQPLRDALVRPYLEPGVSARYEVIQGTVPFSGATIPGEARELCGASVGFHLLDATPRELTDCLPARLAALGYGNIALHGMNGNLFNRARWYRAIGFQEIWFQSQFEQQGLPDCNGALIGTCDADVASWIGRRLEENHPQPYFIHWMTLNSHLPVLVPSSLPNGAPCDEALDLKPETPLCSWYQLVENVHRSLAEIASTKLARPTVFVVVGDHAPPFANSELRDRFSYSNVPYVILLPRERDFQPGAILARNTMLQRRGEARISRQSP
jgi:hypothetical protein